MDSIRNWAWMLCGTVVVCGCFRFLLPSGNSKKAGKLVSALILLSCLLLPVKNDFSLSFPQVPTEQIRETEELQQREEELAYSIAESHILKLIRTALKEEGLSAERIQLTLTEDSLCVELHIPAEFQSREQEIRRILKESYGAQEIEIQWQEEIWTETGKP